MRTVLRKWWRQGVLLSRKKQATKTLTVISPAGSKPPGGWSLSDYECAVLPVVRGDVSMNRTMRRMMMHSSDRFVWKKFLSDWSSGELIFNIPPEHERLSNNALKVIDRRKKRGRGGCAKKMLATVATKMRELQEKNQKSTTA